MQPCILDPLIFTVQRWPWFPWSALKKGFDWLIKFWYWSEMLPPRTYKWLPLDYASWSVCAYCCGRIVRVQIWVAWLVAQAVCLHHCWILWSYTYTLCFSLGIYCPRVASFVVPYPASIDLYDIVVAFLPVYKLWYIYQSYIPAYINMTKWDRSCIECCLLLQVRVLWCWLTSLLVTITSRSYPRAVEGSTVHTHSNSPSTN